ncbi:MAG: hypothetical protein JSS00_10015, partial [Proteobacteria bacterium]|nr:hypothetical protein [Pseudomonadota bacterium]
MIRRSTLIAVEVLLGLVAALAIGLGVAWWRLSQGPVELGFLKQQIQTELSRARSGRPVGIRGVELAWSRGGGSLELRAVGVTVEDGGGHVLSRAREARIELAVLPLIIGRISVVRAEFDGGEITLTQKATGATWVAFGPPGNPPDVILPPLPPGMTLEQSVARLLDGLQTAFAPVGSAGGLKGVGVRNAHLTIVQESSGARWTADAANFLLQRRGDTLTLLANARLEGAQGLAPASLSITTDTRFQAAIVRFGAENVRPRALFSQAALGPFGGLDAPMTAAVLVGLDRRTGVNRFEGDIVVGRGNAEMAGGVFNLAGGRLHGRYDIHSDQLIVDRLQLAGLRTRVRGEARLRDVSRILRAAPNEPAAFDIALPSMTLDVPGTFSAPINLTDVQAVGAIVSADRSINFARLHARTAQGVIDGAGRYYWGEAGPDHALHPGLQLDASVAGVLSVRGVVALWPMSLASGMHGYLDHTLKSGAVTDARAHIDVRPADTVGGPMRNDAINVTFNVSGGEMRFLDSMSPVTNARASAVLGGNSFQMLIPEARLNNLSLSNGRIDIAQFSPHQGQFITISAHAEGDARNIMEVLVQHPLNLRDRIPVDPASVTGRGAVNLTLQRPMEHEVPFSDWRFSVDGRLQNFAGMMSSRHVSLANGQLSVRGDQRAINVTGPIRAGASNVQIAWTERLNQPPSRVSSSYQISGDFDARDLVRLGYSVAQYAEGRVGVTISGQGRGFDLEQARLDLNLNNAAVESPWRFWTKPAGQNASLHVSLGRGPDGGLVLDDIDGRGPGTTIQGIVRLGRDGRIMDVNLPRLVIQGRSNARVTASRGANGGLNFEVRGSLFDAAPFMNGDANMDETEVQPAAAGAPPPRPEPVHASVIVDNLKMRGGVTLSNAHVDLSVWRGALATLIASGQSPGNKLFSLALGARNDDPLGHIAFRSDDAGFAVAALTGTPNVVGGMATADGDWHPGPPTTARINVRLRDFQVVRMPALAQLLSSAGSLTGLAEMLNGDGIGFANLDARLNYANNRVMFTDARMAGPSMGLTGSGGYDIRADNLTVDGVVAPSPILNLSMLSNVPV